MKFQDFNDTRVVGSNHYVCIGQCYFNPSKNPNDHGFPREVNQRLTGQTS
jgi:hypothetical protein